MERPVTDVSGNIVWVNPAFTRMTGYASDEIRGQNPRILKSGKHDKEFYAELWRTIHAGQVWRGEMTNRRKDGSLYVEEQTITPVRDERGELTHFIAIKQDITERKQAEAAVRQKEYMVDNALDIITILDQTGTIRFENPACERETGFLPQELVGRSVFGLIHPEDLPRVQAAMQRGLSVVGQIEILDLRFAHKNGSWVILEARAVAFQEGDELRLLVNSRNITDRKRAEQSLQESETQTRLLLDSTAEAIYGIDIHGLCTFCNSACLRRLGYAEPQQLLGKNMHALMHHTRVGGTPYPVEECRIFQAFRQGEGSHVEDEVLWRADGSSFPAEYWSHPIRKEGQIVGSVVTFLDITERKKLEEQFRQAQQRLSHVVSSSPAVLYTVAISDDQIRGISWMSDNIRDMLGYEATETYGAEWWTAHVHPDDVHPIVDNVHHDLLGQGVAAYEYRFQHCDGSYRWIRSEIRLVRDEGGKAIEAVGSWSDITERKEAEEAYGKVQERLNGLFNSSSDGMVYTTLDGLILDANNAFCQLTGYCRDELVNMRRYQDITPPQFREAEAVRIESILRTGKPEEYEKEYQRKDGKPVPISLTAFAVKNREGHPVGLAGIVKDITERKQLEEQYRQAQKMEAVGRLAGGVAHDFNNLLTVIMGYSEIYLGKLRPEDPLRIPLTEIHKAGERATGLTRQLLAFSRKQVLMPVVLDLNTIIADLEKMLHRLIGEDVTLTVLAGPDLWQVKADPGQMEQVVMNIIVNARDAMPQGGKLLLETKNVELDAGYAQTHTEAKPGEYILVAISDTGCGMDAAVKARIFEPFFTTKGPTKGTGLGLATVFGIVKQSAGHIEVYSEVGQGTTFKIYLPRDRSGEPIALSPRTKEPVRGGTETILLVEDEEGVRTLAREVLQEHGYTVLDARHGGDALVICETRSQPIDLMITDVVMPHFSGRQLAERLATRQPTMKVMFMSGYTDDAIVHHGVLESGMPFLQKPFAPEALIRKVREVLDNKPSQKGRIIPDKKTEGSP